MHVYKNDKKKVPMYIYIFMSVIVLLRSMWKFATLIHFSV